LLPFVAANPSEVFLVEGHTDAVGSEIDNLSLSDRRAESVALVLTQQFAVPAENLTTQGYGEQNLKVPTQSPPRRLNRKPMPHSISPSDACLRLFNKKWAPPRERYGGESRFLCAECQTNQPESATLKEVPMRTDEFPAQWQRRG
jgi:hypothetical protein